MKRHFLILVGCFTLFAISCNNKKLTEVVEVPLPSAEQKMIIGTPDDIKANEGTFELEKLPYSYEALEPNIDALTMEIHYSKQYLYYTNNLNKIIAGTDLEKLPIEEILKKIDGNNIDLRNNAGGYYNHSIYWESMAPKAGGLPKDTLALAIATDFGSFDDFKIQVEDAALKQFGSGWIWLITDSNGKLQITSTSNQDNPLMPNALLKGTPILAIDIWEHAYYLNYQYKRKKYIAAFFKVINWKKVGERYEDALKK